LNKKALDAPGALDMRSSKLRGFTLIELVVVITILGILAAFAVPKFIALDSQARVATINGLAGSVKSAAALARSLDMATSAGLAGPVTMEGSSVALSNSYPDSSAAGIGSALNANTAAGGDFTFAPGDGATTPAAWTKNGAPTPGSCEVIYTPAPANGVPTVAVVTAGC
jgi:MSHA pilin protein MshA